LEGLAVATILLVDTQDEGRALFAAALRGDGHEVLESSGLRAAQAVLHGRRVDVVVTHMRMESGRDGLHLLRHVKVAVPGTEVILLTGLGSVTDAVDAMRMGAYHYLTMPAEPESLLGVVRDAAERRRDADPRSLSAERSLLPDGVVAADSATQSVFSRATKIAKMNCRVLITGESGTGKEVMARVIHRASDRRHQPFVPVNCGGIQESLVESELFGHRRGAFTGALADKQGLAEAADRGVLFLDEVGEMPPSVQARFLRFLDTGEVRRLGETALRHVDVRVIAATNRNLEEDVYDSHFRHDLLYRLRVATVHIPPLRSRPGDIKALARFYLRECCARLGVPARAFSDDALAWLQERRWPGNVRELKNVIESAVATAPGDVITSVDLASAGFAQTSRLGDARSGGTDEERCLAIEALERCHGNHTRAAKVLGISRTTLWRRLREVACP
jgi:two-component system response regulator AtoC